MELPDSGAVSAILSRTRGTGAFQGLRASATCGQLGCHGSDHRFASPDAHIIAERPWQDLQPQALELKIKSLGRDPATFLPKWHPETSMLNQATHLI